MNAITITIITTKNFLLRTVRKTLEILAYGTRVL